VALAGMSAATIEGTSPLPERRICHRCLHEGVAALDDVAVSLADAVASRFHAVCHGPNSAGRSPTATPCGTARSPPPPTRQEDAAAEQAPEHPHGAWQGGGPAAKLAGRLYTSDPSSGIPGRLAPSRKQPITNRDQARTQSRDR